MANSFVQRTIHSLDSEFEPDIERHTRFTETQAGALVCHDYERRQYCRIYQSEVDLDIIRRFVDRNFCSRYPDVTVRYFAQNWPELCIILIIKLTPRSLAELYKRDDMANSFVQRTIHSLDSEFEPDIERHTRFTETQAGALVCHDYERRQYCRIYQSEVDLDIIRRFVDRNFCSRYPDVTVRYFAQNWPELCIITLTDTHIPIGLIIGQQTEPHIGRVVFLAVEKRVEAELIYKRLLQLELERMHAIGIRQVR
ncbi:hypothetical protein AHF37_05609 [Paragonimus kellicotti]|nr:hypothetical protein AHF37_05609 [Paragonimus kellicotti]